MNHEHRMRRAIALFRCEKYRDRDRGNAPGVVRDDTHRQSANMIVEIDSVGNESAMRAQGEIYFVGAIFHRIVERGGDARDTVRIYRAGVTVKGDLSANEVRHPRVLLLLRMIS